MARRGLPAPRGRGGRAAHGVRRLWPYVMMAYERWQSLSPEEKERYKKRARDYADRGRATLQRARDQRPRGRR